MDFDQEEQIRYRVKAIYEAAYGVRTEDIQASRGDVRTSIRSEIRRWITLWDLHRCYPDYAASIVADEVVHDTTEISDESIIASDEQDNGD